MNILKNLIYIYQSEHYDKMRFLKFVYSNFFWNRLSKRGSLDWTMHAKLIFVLIIALQFFVIVGVYFFTKDIKYVIASIFALYFALPFFVIFADILITPAVRYKKNKQIKIASGIIDSLKSDGLATIGITGSYGKTSTKEALATVLSVSKKVYKTSGNINTDIGIAQFIIKNQKEIAGSDVFVVEMSAYKVGEIASTCTIVKPDYSITTSIGQVHIERFGSFENIIKAKFELANATEKLAVLNTCNNVIDENYSEFVKSVVNFVPLCAENINIKYLENFSGISFVYDEHIFETKMIADYAPEMLIPIIKIAKEVGLSDEEIIRGVAKTAQAEHRLEVINNKELNRVIIDDSYNGNYDGFIAGINILKRASERKIVLTPGIVELGDLSEEIHAKLAEKYMEGVDLVVLIQNTNTQYIKNKFEKEGFDSYKMYSSAEEAHTDLANVLQSGDTILFQNDLTDNYN